MVYQNRGQMVYQNQGLGIQVKWSIKTMVKWSDILRYKDDVINDVLNHGQMDHRIMV